MFFRRIGWILLALVGLVCLADNAQAIYYYKDLKPTYLSLPITSASVAKISWPNYGEAAIGIVGGGMLAATDSNLPLPTASVAKIVTALCVLSKYPLAGVSSGPTITLTDQDVALYNTYKAENGSVVEVVAGEKITELQALEALLLPSANNMADSLADWAFGSQTSYDSYANNFVAKLGMTDTHIGGPSGFTPDTTSTARDLFKLGSAALTNQTLASIVSQTTANIPIAGLIHNVNFALGVDGIIGIKTGNIDQDQGVYLFASKQTIVPKREVTLIGAIMGGPSLTAAINNALPLIDSVKAAITYHTYLKSNQPVATYQAPWMANPVEAVVGSSLMALKWQSASPLPVLHLGDLRSNQLGKNDVGTVSVSSIDGKTYSSDIRLKVPLPQPNYAWKLLHPLSRF